MQLPRPDTRNWSGPPYRSPVTPRCGTLPDTTDHGSDGLLGTPRLARERRIIDAKRHRRVGRRLLGKAKPRPRGSQRVSETPTSLMPVTQTMSPASAKKINSIQPRFA
ncbi:MAG: hypothetical protein Ct9H300mP8_02910 [Gammaproteobacteria bacterium]|nr:MAG: hypothetical protein Ct9H300mP8_02910 [Gammaproteobacteria bacterium]